jgi:hypothetical protein
MPANGTQDVWSCKVCWQIPGPVCRVYIKHFFAYNDSVVLCQHNQSRPSTLVARFLTPANPMSCRQPHPAHPAPRFCINHSGACNTASLLAMRFEFHLSISKIGIFRNSLYTPEVPPPRAIAIRARFGLDIPHP